MQHSSALSESSFSGRGRWSRFVSGLSSLSAAFILGLTLLLVLGLLCSAFLSTGSVEFLGAAAEKAVLTQDFLPLNLVTTAVGLLLLWMGHCLLQKLSVRRCLVLFSLLTFLLGTGLIVLSRLTPNPDSDSFILTWAAQEAALGDYAYLREEYFRLFPFQLGFVLYEELVSRFVWLIGRTFPEGYIRLALQELNLFWLLLTELAAVQITAELGFDERVQKLTSLLLFLFLPPLLYITFLYPNTISFAFGLTAVWMQLRYFRREDWVSGLLCALFLALSVVLKMNSLILLVAMAILWLFRLLGHFRGRTLCCLLLTVALPLVLQNAPKAIYGARLDTDFGDGVPTVSWLAMGLSDNPQGPGWYNGTYTIRNFEEHSFDTASAAEASAAVVRHRLENFASGRTDALRFFTEKFLTQWNVPDCQSLWHMNVQAHLSEPSPLFDRLFTEGKDLLLAYMNAFQQLVLVGFVTGLLLLLRRPRMPETILPLILLGGMLYHLLFEAKAQYSFTYYMLMLPIAAMALEALFSRLPVLRKAD